jgi:8-oxo-dGTP pyrophosphatase MutT (NUDIX family)
MNSVIDKKIVYAGKFLKFIRATYTDSHGLVRAWEFIERANCNGIVAIVPVANGHEVLLIRQYRPPVNRYVIEFPAGLNDKGDTMEEAARRELLEETGYYAGSMIFVTEGPLSSGASGEILSVYLAQDLEFRGTAERDETEDIEVIRLAIDELPEHLSRFRSRGDLVDLKILGLLELAKEKMRS